MPSIFSDYFSDHFHFIVCSIATTAWEKGENSDKMPELIGIHAVKLNTKLEYVDEFSSFIRPSLYPQLSDYCMQKTLITQQDIDSAPSFMRIYPALHKFFGWRFTLIAWGQRCKTHLDFACKMYGKDSKWLSKYVNLKKEFARAFGTEQVSLDKALAHLNLSPVANAKSLLEKEAKNATKVLVRSFPQLQHKALRNKYVKV